MDEKTTNIKERILQIADYKGVAKEKFLGEIGATYANFKGKSKDSALNSKVLAEISSKFPDVNLKWLLTGEGSMIANGDQQTAVVKAPEGRLKRRIRAQSGNSKIAFYEVDFEAGRGVEFYDDIRSAAPSYYMDIPDFAGCSAFRTYGRSMQPQIEPGAILFGTKEEDWLEYLEYGQIYGIVLNDNKRLLKKIKKSQKGDKYFLLISANPDFDEFDIPKAKIKNVWLIHGWLNKNS